jgi:hypothetical protein
LKTKNFKDKKLNGAINGIGISFAIFGSTPAVINPLRSKVPADQNMKRLSKYLNPDFE